jgi:hypothetical protein
MEVGQWVSFKEKHLALLKDAIAVKIPRRRRPEAAV